MGEKERMNLGIYNIRDMIANGDEELVKSVISTFSCSRKKDDGTVELLNPDIENFLNKNAIQFTKMKTAITYLVIDEDDAALLGFFTITHKPLNIPTNGISRKVRDKVKRFSSVNEETNSYDVSAFLLAQFAKNYAVENGTRITGSQLMAIVRQKMQEIQNLAGGTIEYLDCEANAGLIKFYESEGFTLFGERISEKDGKRYLQYLSFI